MIKKFLNSLKKSEFDKDFDNLVGDLEPQEIKKHNLNSEILAVLNKHELYENGSFEEIDKYFIDLIKDLKEFYESKRDILGKGIMKSPSLIELNQLTYSLEKNKQLLYREEFNLREFLNFQRILIEQIKKLE